MPEPQFADEAVSRTKFDREVAAFRAQATEYRRRGWYLVHAEFPEAMVLLATPNTQPMAILCGVSFDYTNYDAAAPSVRLVNPMTSEPYRGSELPTQLLKRVPANDAPVIAPQGLPPQVQLEVLAGQPLMQAHKPEDIPFLCIAGVREYHEHPAHSGDHWELYRSSGAGSLTRLVGIVSKYGLEPIAGFNVQMIPQVSFNVGPPPE